MASFTAETVKATLSDIQSMNAGSRVDVIVAVESVLPCKTVSGPKFDGEFSKAVLVDANCLSVYAL